ncbi:hypothetical protein, partial [Acidithiobacillus ferridurans]|uniref:hypothetical protein n=1 Tax=Acidithiobacillus ferridurans TaxID=1232575 RepID=UPI001C0697ED
ACGREDAKSIALTTPRIPVGFAVFCPARSVRQVRRFGSAAPGHGTRAFRWAVWCGDRQTRQASALADGSAAITSARLPRPSSSGISSGCVRRC